MRTDVASCAFDRRFIRRAAVAACILALALLVGALDEDASDAATPSQPLAWSYLTGGVGAQRFLNYDGKQNFNRRDRDWPITLIFYRNASINKVKAKLEEAGLTGFGSREYEGYKYYGESPRFDTDGGRKTDCRGDHDFHYRIYAPPGTVSRFYDTRYGYFTVASTHLDYNEFGCGHPSGSERFGYSEKAEKAIAGLAETIGLSVKRDFIGFRNSEKLRRDVREANHIWQNDGYATAIRIP